MIPAKLIHSEPKKSPDQTTTWQVCLQDNASQQKYEKQQTTSLSLYKYAAVLETCATVTQTDLIPKHNKSNTKFSFIISVTDVQ